MTSDQKRASNRKNALKSTGPRSKVGIGHSSHNARRHGLAVAISLDPSFRNDIETLAIAIEHSRGRTTIGEFARQVAECEVDLLRIRKLRASLFKSVADNPAAGPETHFELNDYLIKLERYERRAFSRRKRALQALS